MRLGSESKSIIYLVPLLFVIFGLYSCSFFESRISVETLSSMEFPRMDLGAAVVNGKIYAIGGFTDQTVPYVEEYNVNTNTWTRKADMPTARCCFAISVINDLIYVTGGMNFTDPNSVTYLLSTEIYNPATDIWTTGTNFLMTLPGSSVFGNAFISGVSAMNKMYVIVANSAETGGSATFEYEPVADSWLEKASPYSDNFWNFWDSDEFTVVACNDKIYLFGRDDLIEYNPVGDNWTTRPSAFDGRQLGTVNVLGDNIYAIYGIDSLNYPIYGVEVYNTTANLWSRQGWIKNPRVFFSSVSLGDSVYVIGGAFYADRNWADPLGLVERVFMRD